MMEFPAITELLPHRPPMVLLDEVLTFDDPTATCRVTLNEASMFMEQGVLRAVVALEYMAQCVGVCTSLRALTRGEPVSAGYLIGARELQLEREQFQAGDELLVEATLAFDGEKMGSFDCRVLRRDELVACGVLSVYRQQLEG